MTDDTLDGSQLRDADHVTVTEEDGLYVATDEETGVSSQGPTTERALENLAAALASYEAATTPDEDDWL